MRQVSRGSAGGRSRTAGFSGEVVRLVEMIFRKLSITEAWASLALQGRDGRFGRGPRNVTGWSVTGPRGAA